MNIVNQKPTVLSPIIMDKISADFDPLELLKGVIADPLFTPLVPTAKVSITDNTGTSITADDIRDMYLACCGEGTDIAAENRMKDLFSQTLLHYNKNTTLMARDVFAIQASVQAKLPEPSDKTIYTPTSDIIPTCRKFLAGQLDYETLFASFAFYTRANTLGVYCANELVFDDFKTWVSQQMNALGSSLDPDVCQKMNDFLNLSLAQLTESILIRNQDTDDNEPYSFSRLISYLIMQYVGNVSPSEMGLFPFSVPELICPKTIVFVNIERHQKATSRQIADEWKIINNALQTKPPLVSLKKLSKLTAVQRSLQKMQGAATATANLQSVMAARAARFAFRKTEPTAMDMARIIKKIMDKMAYINKSMNVYKQVKNSFARPNRRDPDDWNKQGKVVSTKYKPDIHLYIDVSGSITERNYQDAIKACIAMAKKLNVNLYFNSFSDSLSQGTRLHVQDKTKAAIYREFQKVPKVAPWGTDYTLVWHYINRSKKRKQEISVMITDFEFSAPPHFIAHPKNLYYIPCGKMDWDRIRYAAESFAKTMVHNDPAIRKHILF